MENLTERIDRKRGRLFLVKRAEALEVLPHSRQMDIAFDDFCNIDPVLYPTQQVIGYQVYAYLGF